MRASTVARHRILGRSSGQCFRMISSVRPAKAKWILGVDGRRIRLPASVSSSPSGPSTCRRHIRAILSMGRKMDSGQLSVNIGSEWSDRARCWSKDCRSDSYISAREYVTEATEPLLLLCTGGLAVTRITFSPTGRISQSLATLMAVNKLSPDGK